MSRCVDLDERVTAQFYDQECEEWTMQTVTIEDVLDSVCDDYTILPSAQLEIIRCKDCKYYKTKFCALDTWTNEITIYNAQPNDFCSRAKRRGENDG